MTHFATILLLPGHSLMSFAALTEPLRGANRVAGREVFAWRLLSPAGGEVHTSGGMVNQTLPIGTPDPRWNEDMVLVCGGQEDTTYSDKRILHYLRAARTRGSLIAAASTASFLLARAGLLDGRRCTTHWDYLGALREQYPGAAVENGIFVIDGRLATCAGGIAALDMMLQIIRQLEGDSLAALVAENFVYGDMRRADAKQRLNLRERLGVPHPGLLAAVAVMEEHVETPLSITRVADQAGLSLRQMERLFEQHFRVSPIRYYADLRLDRARRLLKHSPMDVTGVALACGFTSPAHFSRAYRLRFGRAPRFDRSG
ncbi:GlxA family transcriptional regulator [Microbaculum sp. FT89]|uniref:GlxA family transcriptional regulator n=1 Tax=Microbaculum sp. FT89 TaxID=3447298 RepID=UPI003F52D9B3